MKKTIEERHARIEEMLARCQRNDPIACRLADLHGCLQWIDDHRAGFLKLRDSEPELAEAELGYLAHMTREARKSLDKLTQLLLAGGSIDSSKILSTGPWNKETSAD